MSNEKGRYTNSTQPPHCPRVTGPGSEYKLSHGESSAITAAICAICRGEGAGKVVEENGQRT